MHIILGANGHIGSALARTLLERGERVTVVLHAPDKAPDWQQKGAQVAIADVRDTDGLREVFRRGRRLFLLNPPAAPATDTDSEERQTLASILAALPGSGLEKIVAESTYGAQPGAHLGDLGVLYEMEESLAAQPIPAHIIRGAYYMSNWAMALPTVQQKGQLPTFYPPDFELPMVAPADIGQLAADLMIKPASKTGLHYIEGPQRYSARDVAAAFAEVLGQPVEAVTTPREQWAGTLQGMGFSDKAAASFAAMTAKTLEAPCLPDAPVRGATTLQQYLRDLVANAA